MLIKKYLGIDDATCFLASRGVSIQLSDLQDLARERILTPLVYAEVKFIESKLPDGSPFNFDRKYIKNCERISAYFKVNGLLLLDGYNSYQGAICFNEADANDRNNTFEVVTCTKSITDAQSMVGKVGYAFHLSNKDDNGGPSRLDYFSIADIRFHRTELEAISSEITNNDLKITNQLIVDLEQNNQQAQANIADLENQLKLTKEKLATVKAATKTQPYDWQSIGKDERAYPPELHLAMMIWQRIYQDNELKDTHHVSHNSKFMVIAKDMNLMPNTALYDRVRIIINTAYSKNQQALLANPLRAIKQLHMPANVILTE